MDKPSFVYVSYIRATRERIWQALTDGAITEKYWFRHRIESEPRAGGPLRFYDGSGKLVHDDRILLWEPPSVLSYTWKPLHDRFAAEVESRVTFSLEEVGQHVKLTMTHDAFEPGSKVLPAVEQGWPAVLSSLKSLLETGWALAEMRPPRQES